MQGIHDLGGLEGMGPVEVEPDEPVFHHDWERQALRLVFGASAASLNRSTAQFRHSIERMDAVHYLTSRYYEHWLTGLATRLVETGVLTREELEERAGGAFPLSSPVAPHIAVPEPSDRRFEVGDEVRARRFDTRGHSRCPGYVQGRVGTVVRVHPPAPLPELDAHLPHGEEARAEAVYTVRFDHMYVDLWESYVELA